MADPTVKLVFTGNSADAERAIAGLERKYASLEEKLKRTQAASKSGFDSRNAEGFGTALDGVAARMATILTAGQAASMVMSGLADEAERFADAMDQDWAKFREEQSKLKVQDGLTDEQVQAQMPVIKAAALKTPVFQHASEAIDAQRQLSSVGIDEGDVKSGKALDTMAQLKALSNAYGDAAEPTEVTAKSLSQYLKATGGGNKAEDIKRIGEKIAALSSDSSINVSDMAQLSQNAATLTQFGVDEDQQLAAYRVAFEAQGGAVGGTGLRNMVSRLGTAGTEKKKVAALNDLGLKPEDVAVAEGGVSIDDALMKLRGATKGMDETKKNEALKELFGEESMSTASILLSDSGWQRYQEGLEKTRNAKGEADKRIQAFQGSREAMNRRNKLEPQFKRGEMAEGEMTWEEYGQAEERRNTEEISKTKPGTLGRLGQYWIQFTEGMADRFSKSIGHSPESAARMQPGGMIDEEMKRQTEEMKKQTELLDKMANKPEPPPRPNIRGQREGSP